jgi:plastocyanin
MNAKRLPAGAERRIRKVLPIRLVAAGPLLALVVAACASASGAPAYTYPPSAPASTGGSAAPSGLTTPSASAMAMPPASAPTANGSAAPAPSAATPSAATPSAATPSAGTAPAGVTVHLSAQAIQFDTATLAAPAGQAWSLVFANNDAGIPHNVEIRDAAGASVFKGQIVTGPTTVTYQVPALAAGSYTFLCDVHPTMTGALTVS